MKEEQFQISHSGIKCDNEKCDYRDDDVKYEDYENWLNKLCPKCGENLLTQEDLENSVRLHTILNAIGSMKEDELKKFASLLDLEAIKNMEPFKNIDWKNVKETDLMEIKFETHNGISIKEANVIRDEKDHNTN